MIDAMVSKTSKYLLHFNSLSYIAYRVTDEKNIIEIMFIGIPATFEYGLEYTIIHETSQYCGEKL